MSAARAKAALRERGLGEQGGFALVAVLLVLLALLVLATPLLLSARGADQAANRLAERAEARIALDSAARHARLVLSDTYSSADLDRTPYHDGEDELTVENRFPEGFLDANDARGLMWDVEARDLAGHIDLDSASPQVLANVMGLSGRLTTVVPADAKEIPLSSTVQLEPQGFVWVGGELVHYTRFDGPTLVEFTRGVLGPPEGTEWRGGPRPASPHGIGAPFLDQRAMAPALWRLVSEDGEPRSFESPERLRESARFALAAATDPAGEGVLREELVRRLLDACAPQGGVRAGPRWQRAARLISEVKGGEDGVLRVDDARWFNPGATVRVRDGQSSELALVQERRSGQIVLDRVLAQDYLAFEAVVDVLARRPVNLNSAPRAVLEALFLNLQIAGRNSRVTQDEAATLAGLVIDSRPLEGLEDFLRRVVLPAAGIERLPSDAPFAPDVLRAGEGFLDPWDALAVYANGLNANDASLEWSTMPYSFTSCDVYELELRAAVNAPSGVLRQEAVRTDVTCIAPQRELIRLWARQEDFDEELRLSAAAPWWLTAPNATSRWDGTLPPSRLWAHLGTYEGAAYLPGVTDTSAFTNLDAPPTPEHVFAAREDSAWAQLMPTRLYETTKLQGRVVHFDHETRDPEGRYLPDEPFARPTDDKLVAWTDASTPLLRSPACALWLRPRALSDGRVVDVMGTSREVDRMSLQIEGPDLVLRVLDGFGDHPASAITEAGELRYELGGAPGLPVDVWHHVELDVRGNRPSQMHMLVNGLAQGVRAPGLTRLAGALPQNSSTIAVESVEGFPPRCVVRIGNELIEAAVQGAGLAAVREETGEWAGFGGRLAREPAALLDEDQASPPRDLANLSTDHAAGTPVELYGYSLPLQSDVPAGEATLAQPLGRFRVAMVAGTEGPSSQQGEPVVFGLFGVTAGFGMKGANSEVTGLVLRCADDGDDTNSVTPPEEFMPAFHQGGGYAAIVQIAWSYGNGEVTDSDGSTLGGIEIVRYSGWSNSTLVLAQRGISDAQLPNLSPLPQNGARFLGGMRSFVATWNPALQTGGGAGGGVQVASQLAWRTYVVPISLAVPGASDVRGFLAAQAGESEFAQLTHVADAELTEWVRYDWFDSASQQLVRDDPSNLISNLYAVLTRNQRLRANQNPPPGDPTDPGGTGGGGGGGGALHELALDPPAHPPEPKLAAPVAQQPSASSAWEPRIGDNGNPAADWPITRAVETYFQFRGVFATYSQEHPAGTPIHPVFQCADRGFDGGRPGRGDTVFLVGSDPSHPGWPVTVHRAHIPPPEYAVRAWAPSATTPSYPETAVPDPDTAPTDGYLLGRSYVALRERSPENVLAGAVGGGGAPVVDTRLIARLVSFPSGERPRAVSRLQVGGDADSGGAVPSALADEVAFGDAQFARGTPGLDPEHVNGASLVLSADADESALELFVLPSTVRIALSNISATYDYLDELPGNGGLLRIGDEILAYASRDPQTGRIELAQDGRGRLGTRAQAHETHDPVLFLEHRVATVLVAPVGASDSALPVASTDGFPPEGLVLVGDELVHYTHQRGDAFEMPRASTVPGALDGRGEGLFRGRFGSQPAAHAAGDAVILFPLRYPDRWARRADAPELAYFGFGVSQPSAFWSGVFFAKQDSDSARLGLVQRSSPDAPWDADPDQDERLQVLWQGELEGRPVPIGRQTDRIEWRAFVEYQSGAFDPLSGVAHGWRQTPRLTMLSAFYLAPPVTLRSVER